MTVSTLSAFVVIVALTQISLLKFTDAHAVLCTPRQRGGYESDDRCLTKVPVNPPISGAQRDYCPFCQNGGGIRSTRSHLPTSGWSLYNPVENPNFHATASLCGDAKGNIDHMLGGKYVPTFSPPIVSEWESGSTINLQFEMSANHFGFFEFYVCDLDACDQKDISQDCFKKKTCYKLKRVAHEGCEKQDPKVEAQCTPIDKNYPDRWYVPCKRPKEMENSLHMMGGSNGYMKYKLPDGVSCKHCVFQWYWATGNGCLPVGVGEFLGGLGKGFSDTCPLVGMTQCGPDRNPEEYWSCADVRIINMSKSYQDKNDINNSRNHNSNSQTKQKRKKKSQCVKKGRKCDGSIPCCNRIREHRACMYKQHRGDFVCAAK